MSKLQHDMYQRIDGLVNIKLVDEFIDQFAAICTDAQNEEPFETADVIKYLTAKMNEKEI
tara:strand:+ start:296 stop:475 length:180 start_codon:yes stop_codon:yes gene_type:complete